MKRLLIVLIMLVGLLFPSQAAAQSQEMQQLILNIEKLAQFKQILTDMKKGYQILNGGYNVVKDLSKGNFSLHETFLDALMQVSPTVRKYKRVGEIIHYQVLLVKEYKAAFNRFRNSGNFNPEEIAYLEKVYSKLFKESIRNLDELTSVISANTLRMSDDERLAAIDKVYADMQDKLSFLRNFNNNTSVLGIQRTKERNDINAMRSIYQVNN
ncbi:MULTISPECIES: TerB family tellurite resistance protein [Flavobacterium]|jgi:DNA repair ATPase RecN|uniref:TerB family tellurite resistance protein n=1 Tax=Flavobacterium psychrolimnae TaxID=249351 RepID=A0A366AXS1_9FLAO|nr:TerB family tellurite resistance protein [Flavobacterium psychrolimnae]MDD2675266.1 TerB family tellurite resistance protein [Flavobacterium sp.]RBN49451.1 TerB family tellurite resistance protein [Flavobacterium psychrolimnae]